jgi:hypothetical protein
LGIAGYTERQWLLNNPGEPTHDRPCPECAEPIKAAARVCRFCGHRLDAPAAAGPAPAAQAASASSGSGGGALKALLGVAVAVLMVLWFSGTLDKPLSSVGLNKNACVQNAFGATFCGEQARSVCSTFGGEGCRDAGYDTSGSLEEDLSDLDSQLEDIGGP